MPTTIPLTSDPSQTFSIDLEGAIYQFRVICNQRNATWSADLYDAEGVLLVAGIPLLIGPDLLRQYNLEVGGLFMVDSGLGDIDATLESGDLGTRVVLVHLTEEELAELE